jgi:DNA modification methylase
MSNKVNMETNKIYNEDCRETLKRMPQQFIQCCVTSPPYYGLRDYGHDGQIGLEETPEQYVEKLVEVFRLVRDKMKDDGTLWLNLGDSYSSHKDCKSVGQTLAAGTSRENAHVMELGKSRVRDSKMLKSQGLKNKDLIGIPWMVAFALRADGWYLRQDIIWHKPNPMPESVTDRCTKSHEYIFLLSKSQRYYYNHEAIKEPLAENSDVEYRQKLREGKKYDSKTPYENNFPSTFDLDGRNKRSVWTVTTKPFRDAHFATFPIRLITPCILAGSPEDGIIYDPFMGAATTAIASIQNNRRYIGSELNPDYIRISERRIRNEAVQYKLF